MLEDVSAVIGLDHREMTSTNFFCETVKRRYNICMRRQVDPSRDIFIVGYLTDDKLLTEVFVIDYKGCVADHVFHLEKENKISK